MKPPIPLHDPRFIWIPSRDHDAGSDAFRERQRQRMREAQAKAAANVRTIGKRRATA